MYQGSFGTKKQIQFVNPMQYYEFIGYLAKEDRSSTILFNRILFFKNNIPRLGMLKYSKGNGTTCYRINCIEFVNHIIKYHKFKLGNSQNPEDIESTIPDIYLKYFKVGLNR